MTTMQCPACAGSMSVTTDTLLARIAVCCPHCGETVRYAPKTGAMARCAPDYRAARDRQAAWLVVKWVFLVAVAIVLGLIVVGLAV